MGEDGGGTFHQGELDGKTVAIKPNEVLCAVYGMVKGWKGPETEIFRDFRWYWKTMLQFFNLFL